MPEGKWVSKENLQTFWQSIRSNLTSIVTEEVNNILPPIIQEDVIDAYIPDILGNFAEVEDTPTATKNYAIGDYLVLNKHFYKATAAITSGDTLVEGTNITRTNVGAESKISTDRCITKDFTIGNVTVAGNGGSTAKAVNASLSGYKPVGIICYSSSDTNVIMLANWVMGSDGVITMHFVNCYNGERSTNATIRVLYIPN